MAESGGGEEGNGDIPDGQLTRDHDFSLGFKFLVARSALEKDVDISDHRKVRDLAGCELPA